MKTLEELQQEGVCGYMQNNGRRCSNPVIEWFTKDPDVPGSARVGACGVHAEDVRNDVSRHIHYTSDRVFRAYEEAERRRGVIILSGLGIKAQHHYSGEIIVNNWGHLLQWVASENPQEELHWDATAFDAKIKEEAKQEAHKMNQEYANKLRQRVRDCDQKEYDLRRREEAIARREQTLEADMQRRAQELADSITDEKVQELVDKVAKEKLRKMLESD